MRRAARGIGVRRKRGETAEQVRARALARQPMIVEELRGPSAPGCPGMTIDEYEQFIATSERHLVWLRQELADLRNRATNTQDVN